MPEPLAADQYSIRFAAEPLPEQERAELVAHGRAEFAKLFGNIRFAMESGFGTKVRSSSRSTRAIICVPTQIHATIDEVAEVFFSDRTNAAIGFAQSQSIYNVLEPSAEHPLRSCGLRWSLWHSPSKLIRQRDICYIEYMDTFVDENGRRGWARCTHSVVHRSCPSLINSHGVVRAHLGCSGTVYTETDTPGLLDVITLYDCDTKGVPAWMTKFVAVRKAKNPHLLEHLIRLARAANESLVADFTKTVVAPQQHEKVCFGCGDALSKWSVTSRKCRECHELLCKSCNDVVYCAIEGGKKLNRICMHCVDRFLAEGDGKRVDMYSDSGSHSTPQGLTRKGSNASFRSTKRVSEDEWVDSRSGSVDGAKSSPTPMLEDRPPMGTPNQQYQQQQYQQHQQQQQRPPMNHRQPAQYQQQYQQMQQHQNHRKPTPQQHRQPTQQQHQYQQQQQQNQYQQPAPHQSMQPKQELPAAAAAAAASSAAPAPAPLAPPPPHVPRYTPIVHTSNPKLINVNASRTKVTRTYSAADIDLSYLSTFKTAASTRS